MQAKDKINTRLSRVSIQQAKHFTVNNDRLQIDLNTYSSKLRFIRGPNQWLNIMTEQLTEFSEKIQSKGRQPNIVVDPRLQSSHGSDDLENDYQFFRTLVKNNIFQLTNLSGTAGTIQHNICSP